MVFNTGAALLDAIVLAVVSKESEGTYGYKITQDVRQALEVSESTLYPVLRRLQKDECLETYDKEYGGRNRRYYKVTEKGMVQLNLYRAEWAFHHQQICGSPIFPIPVFQNNLGRTERRNNGCNLHIASCNQFRQFRRNSCS